MMRLPRNRHVLNHYRLLTCSMGEIVPVGVTEVLPGDSFRHMSSALMRFGPLVTPVMHPVYVKMHHWFVPNRIIWDDWEGFITGADSEAAIPTVTQDGNSDLLDHMGVDPAATGTEVNALPVRAYNKIYNDIYRDNDLQTEVSEDQLTVLSSNWEKDYFTRCRATPQQGAEVTIPFSAAEAPVLGIGTVDTTSWGTSSNVRQSDGSTVTYSEGISTSQATGGRIEGDGSQYPYIRADLSQATGGINVTDFRTAMALQRFAEARAFYGERYVDFLRYWGIRPRDGRLDRPEYLGGGRQTVSFSEVLATAEAGSQVVGGLAGHGIAAVRTRPYRKFFEEHGWCISVMQVIPRGIYGQALPRHFLRTTKEEYYQRELEMVGPQAVTNREVYPAHSAPEDTFGWCGRYDEYRQAPSYISGEFRDAAYDEWHLARLFGSDPALNSSFVQCDASNRIFAAPSEPNLQIMAQHFITAQRAVSRKATT